MFTRTENFTVFGGAYLTETHSSHPMPRKATGIGPLAAVLSALVFRRPDHIWSRRGPQGCSCHGLWFPEWWLDRGACDASAAGNGVVKGA